MPLRGTRPAEAGACASLLISVSVFPVGKAT